MTKTNRQEADDAYGRARAARRGLPAPAFSWLLRLYFAAVVLVALSTVLGFGVAIYVIYHFLTKFW